jgi:hypothetical protein
MAAGRVGRPRFDLRGVPDDDGMGSAPAGYMYSYRPTRSASWVASKINIPRQTVAGWVYRGEVPNMVVAFYVMEKLGLSLGELVVYLRASGVDAPLLDRPEAQDARAASELPISAVGDDLDAMRARTRSALAAGGASPELIEQVVSALGVDEPARSSFPSAPTSFLSAAESEQQAPSAPREQGDGSRQRSE